MKEFKQGDRVKLSEEGEQHILPTRRTASVSGTVTSDSNGEYVRVLRDGLKNTSTYHIKFWERINLDEQN